MEKRIIEALDKITRAAASVALVFAIFASIVALANILAELLN